MKYFSINSRIKRAEKKLEKLIDKKVKKEGLPELSKHKDFSKMAEVYRDSNGKRYYKYIDDMSVPVIRFAKLQSFIIELGNCLSRDELKMLIDAIKKALAGEKNGGKPDHAMIGFIVTEMENRQNYLIYEDILFKMVASLYIHEDQSPNVWDEELEFNKVKQFKIDSENNYNFFVEAGLSKYITSLDSLKENWNELSEIMEKKKKALKEMIGKYGLDPKLSTTLEGEKMN